MTLHDRIRVVVEERLAVAREASRRDEHTTPTGEHWRWECGNCDTVLAITPVTVLSEYLECPACEGHPHGHGSVALRSAEQYPTVSVGPLPHFVVNYASEQRSVDALHIAANDPADAILSAEHALGILERHAIVHRSIHIADDLDTYEELPVCGRCVPKHSTFRTRAEVPAACEPLRALATRWRVEVDG